VIADGRPEKAGVGGSIPSLAAIFSIAYRPPDSQFHSNSFQFQKSTGFYLRVDLRVWSGLFALKNSRFSETEKKEGER